MYRHKNGTPIGSGNCLKSIDYKNTQDFEIWAWNVGEISNLKRTAWVETPCKGWGGNSLNLWCDKVLNVNAAIIAKDFQG